MVLVITLETSPPKYSQPLQLLRTRINSGNHPKNPTTRKACCVPEKRFNCLEPRKKNNQKRTVEEYKKHYMVLTCAFCICMYNITRQTSADAVESSDVQLVAGPTPQVRQHMLRCTRFYLQLFPVAMFPFVVDHVS